MFILGRKCYKNFDRELRSKVLKEALLLLLFLILAWNQVKKRYKGNKIMFANKKVKREQKMYGDENCYKLNGKLLEEIKLWR